LLKYELLDEAFSINDSTDLDEIRNMRKKLKDYLKKHGEDYQVRNVIAMLDVFYTENRFGSFEACYEVAESVFETLSKIDKWDFYDIRAIVPLIDYYSPNFEQIDYQAEKVLKKLEKFSDEERYPHIKSAIHMNMLLRTLRAKVDYSEDMQDPLRAKKLEQIFSKHYDEICNADGFPVRKAAAMVRKGRFFEDQSLIDEGFKTLESLGENNWIEGLKKEFSEFDRDEKFANRMNEADILIGRNFKKAREARGYFKEDIAAHIFKTAHDITLIEAGRQKISTADLRRAAGFLGVSFAEFYNDDIEITKDSPAALYREKREVGISRLLNKMSNDEIDLIYNTAKAVVNLNVPPESDFGDDD